MGSKKLTAVLLATVLGISTAPINAWADSYTDVEAVAVTRAIENFCTNYDILSITERRYFHELFKELFL